MIKSIIVCMFLSFVVAFSSSAQDSDRIGQLEKEVQELKARLSKLEKWGQIYFPSQSLLLGRPRPRLKEWGRIYFFA